MELPFYLEPPGAYKEILSHPYNDNKAVDVAIFHEHRLAFYYWADWTKGILHGTPKDRPPVLVTLDWHEDTVAPDEEDCEELRNIDFSRLGNVAFFSWAKLNPLNDGHILSAAYLNLISDIFIVCKQRIDNHQPLEDMYGNVHRIYSYHSIDEMLTALKQHPKTEQIYFDVDLDFFTESDDSCGGGDNITLVSQSTIANIIKPDSTLMQFVLPRLAGMTIALEPEFCGGINNMYTLFHTLESTLFDGDLIGKKVKWKKSANNP